MLLLMLLFKLLLLLKLKLSSWPPWLLFQQATVSPVNELLFSRLRRLRWILLLLTLMMRVKVLMKGESDGADEKSASVTMMLMAWSP